MGYLDAPDAESFKSGSKSFAQLETHTTDNIYILVYND
jgi:hypothetical protein